MSRGLTIIILSFILCIGCDLTIKIQNGDMAYQLKHYALAAELYEKEFNAAPNNDGKAYSARMLSKTYQKLNNLSKAYEWLEQYGNLSKGDDEALKQFGLLAASNGDEKLAIKVFKNLYQNTKDRNYLRQQGYIEKLAYDDKVYDVDCSPVNTEYAEYSPVKFETNYIAFSSDRPSPERDIDNTYSGRGLSQLYLVSSRSSSAFLFDEPVNSNSGNGHAAFTPKYDEVYFTRCVEMEERDVHCRIYHSRRFNGRWKEPTPILFFDESVNVGHPAFLAKDSILIFSAKNGDNYQLYYSQKLASAWALPELMPEQISGPYDEQFPVIEEDTLYFSSTTFPGYGGLDIYKTYIDQRGFWTKPELLPSPYNSAADDFGLCMLRRYDQGSTVSEALISSNRSGCQGLDDIFQITQYRIEEEKPTEPEGTDYKTYLAVKITDAATNLPLEGNFKLITDSQSTTNEKTDRKGRWTEEKPSGGYTLTTEFPAYYTKSIAINIPSEISSDSTINLAVKLEKIEVGKEIILEDIYYDYDKWDIRQDARPSLLRLVKLLNENPSIKIELASHTDCRGDNDYNLDLSQKRAQSAVRFLIQSGVSQNRLTSRGYGETVPQDDCPCDVCSDDQHQKNRRTTFKVTAVD